jgi:hypothetical protein
MSQDPIQELWSKGKKAEVPMTRQELVELLRPEVRRTRWVFPVHLWFYLAFLAAVLVVDIANLVVYRSNPVLLAVQAAVTALTLGLLAYTAIVLREARGLARLDDDLASIVRRRLRFFETKYGVWLWLAALSVAVASWAVSTLVDSAGGQYRINRPGTFTATLLGQIAIVYAALRVAHEPFLAESRAVLHDLAAQALDETRALPRRRARWRRIRAVWIGVLLVLLLLGIAVALGLWWR